MGNIKAPKATTTGLYNGTSGIKSGPKAVYDEVLGDDVVQPFTTQENSPAWYDPFSFGNYGQDANSAVLNQGLYQDGTKMNQNDKFLQSYGNSLDSETALRNAQIEDMQGFDYMGAGSLAMQGIGTAMQMGLYGDRKDYMKNTNAALEQNMQNAEESHNTRQANTASYGSAFSNA